MRAASPRVVRTHHVFTQMATIRVVMAVCATGYTAIGPIILM
jgi:hypothetical protein